MNLHLIVYQIVLNIRNLCIYSNYLIKKSIPKGLNKYLRVSNSSVVTKQSKQQLASTGSKMMDFIRLLNKKNLKNTI